MTQEYMERLAAAIKATEYKYFGDYELSPDQWDAVNTLVDHAKQCAGLQPIAWMYERNGVSKYHAQRSPEMAPAWTETPLYFIPAPEPKP